MKLPNPKLKPNLLQRLASGAAPAVFVAVGAGSAERVGDLFLAAGIFRALSPRHANLLLVAGEPRDDDLAALQKIHDQMLPPRATLFWGAPPIDGLKSAPAIAADDDPLPHLLRLQVQLSRGELAGEPDLLPDEPPAPWRGVGDHGQGGKGMMGGNPYGRPMAMTADDGRDGLALDQVTLQLGPYLHPWQVGLVLEWVLQGDVVQSARVMRAPLAPARDAAESPGADLRAAVGLLTLLELHALAERCGRAAAALDRGESVDVAGLASAVRRAGGCVAIPPELGRCRIGGRSSDVRSRLQGWLSTTAPKVSAADGARDAEDGPGRLVDLLAGLEWNEAMLVVNSFTPMQLGPMAPAEPPPEDDLDLESDSDGDSDIEADADGPPTAHASHCDAPMAHPA